MKRIIAGPSLFLCLMIPGILKAQSCVTSETETLSDCGAATRQHLADSCLRSCGLADVQVEGYIDNTFTVNSAHPDDRVNSLRVFDRKDRAYLFNLFQIYVHKDPDENSRWGFATKLNAGWDADVISSYEEDNTDRADIEEAFLSYLFPVGNGLLVKAGKFVTLHGAEVIEQKDNWNISRSFLFGYAIPFTHTGVRAQYALNDTCDLTFGAVSGWDTFRHDTNDALTYEARLGINCSDRVSMSFCYMWGPEQVDNDHDVRQLFDWVATCKLTDKLTAMLNADIAREENATDDGRDARWNGIAGYLKYDCTDKLSYAVRTELFHDEQGVRTGTHQTLGEITLTSQYKFAENLRGRLEYRHDASTDEVFSRGRGFGSNQNTVAVSMLMTF